jgi:two-component system, NtrC family, sensor kinase
MPSEVSTLGRGQSVEELRRELAEAREQQAATAGILAAISNSPTDARRVFAEIAASAARLCDAYDAGVLQRSGDHLLLLTDHGPIPALGRVGQVVSPLTRGLVVGRAVLERQTIHVADLQAERHEYPEGSEFACRLGHRTILAVPLIRADEAIGAIYIRRTEVRPFTDRQIELLKTFADQAVIAIENARLFDEVQTRTNELETALERQTATAEILSVISSSPGTLEPVFDAILTKARELCGAKFGHLILFDGEVWRAAALHNVPKAYAEFWERTPVVALPGTLLKRLLETRQPFQVDDARLGAAYIARAPIAVATIELAGARTLLGVPLLKDRKVIGAIVLYRTEVQPTRNRLSCSLALPHRQLSPSRMRASSTICGNRSSSRPPLPTCSRSSVARPSTCSLSSKL